MTAPEPITLDEIVGYERAARDRALKLESHVIQRLCAAARRGVEADETLAGITAEWKKQYEGEKERGDLWMVDCKEAQAALAEAVRREREAIELLRQAREYTTKYNAIGGPAARSFPDGNPENATQVQSGPHPTEHAASPAASIGESE